MDVNDIRSIKLYYYSCLSENMVVYLFWLVYTDGVQRGRAAGKHSQVKSADQFAGSGGRRSQLLFGTSSELYDNTKQSELVNYEDVL